MSLLKTIIQSVQPIERRSEPRTFSEAQVILQWDAPESRVAPATVLDWSARGVRIRHRLPLRKDQLVNVVTPDWTLSARVVWTGDLDGAEEAGLMFEPRRKPL
jgi:hypothetical protein